MQQDVLHRQRKEILTFLNKVNSFEKLNGYDLKMLATVSKVRAKKNILALLSLLINFVFFRFRLCGLRKAITSSDKEAR